MPPLPTILVIDDEVRSLEAIRRTLEEEFEVLTATSASEAAEMLENSSVEVILCDQRMPGETGVTFLERVRRDRPDVVRIILSGYTDTEDIIDGVNKAGIYQYIPKPWHPEVLLERVREAARLHRLGRQNHDLSFEMRVLEPVLQGEVARRRQAVRNRFDFSKIIRSEESSLNALCSMVERFSRYDIPILITGESGTGKELLARSIHYNSPRSDAAFVAENCGALPDQLLESELFGHKKGAFTGAYEDRIGLFEQANGGTIFLDEIGETSPAFQVKLLRVLQEREIRPLGVSRSRKVDVRVIAATNRDLELEVSEKRFRQDLYYRVAGFSVHMPPLRERPSDIPLLARHVLGNAIDALGKPVRGFSNDAMNRLCAYGWPGNVRELQNEVFRMLALSDDEVLGAELLSSRIQGSGEEVSEGSGNLKDRVEMMEGRIILETLKRLRWNRTKAADELGLSRVGLRNKLKRYRLEEE